MTAPAMGRYEIYDRRTGETIEAGYTRREAHNSIAWCWNTGGEVDHLDVRQTAELPVPQHLCDSGRRLHRGGGKPGSA